MSNVDRIIDPGETMQTPLVTRPLERLLLDAWFELNYRLQEESCDTHINKAFVERWITRLWTIGSPQPQCFWLFMARINELALVCASRYVDCCEWEAAEELLVEPSSVFFRVEGEVPDSEGKGACVEDEKKAPPLLPCLYDLLNHSGCMTEGYMRSVCRRTEKLSQVTEMLRSMGIGSMQDISMKLSCMGVDQRGEFRSRLCLFDQKTFNEIGRALHLYMHHGNVHDEYVGKYLRG